MHRYDAQEARKDGVVYLPPRYIRPEEIWSEVQSLCLLSLTLYFYHYVARVNGKEMGLMENDGGTAMVWTFG